VTAPYDMAGRAEWAAEITRGSWCTWHIDPVKGVTGLREGYLAFGTRRHAERVARRKLARLRHADERLAAREIIR